jgi:hypothetical protein
MRSAVVQISALTLLSSAEQFLVPSTKVQPVGVLAKPSTDSFEATCQGEEDYGWPRFQSRDELAASPWAVYFIEVYGDLPAPEAYPVCVYDLWYLDAAAWKKAGISGFEPKTDLSNLKNGDLFYSNLLMIYHDVWQPAPANTWIEVTHSAFPSELTGMWCWRTRGSGIWFNTGNTIVFPSPADPSKTHAEAIAFLMKDCSWKVSPRWPRQESDIFGHCAREKGYDSIQFEPTTGVLPMGTFGLPGLTELVITGLDGQYNCGTENAAETTLRSGWRASSACECDNLPKDESCGLMPRAPFPMSVFPPLFVEPPLCELQRRHPWKACDPTTCSNSFCRVRNSSSVNASVV